MSPVRVTGARGKTAGIGAGVGRFVGAGSGILAISARSSGVKSAKFSATARVGTFKTGRRGGCAMGTGAEIGDTPKRAAGAATVAGGGGTGAATVHGLAMGDPGGASAATTAKT